MTQVNIPPSPGRVVMYSNSLPDGPNPVLHAVAVVILILAALGIASTIIALPFGLLPSARPSPHKAAAPTRSSSLSSSNTIRVPNAMPNIGLSTWMTFFLVMSLLIVALQGPLGYGLSPTGLQSRNRMQQTPALQGLTGQCI